MVAMLWGLDRSPAPGVHVFELPGFVRMLRAGPCDVGVGGWGCGRVEAYALRGMGWCNTIPEEPHCIGSAVARADDGTLLADVGVGVGAGASMPGEGVTGVEAML